MKKQQKKKKKSKKPKDNTSAEDADAELNTEETADTEMTDKTQEAVEEKVDEGPESAEPAEPVPVNIEDAAHSAQEAKEEAPVSVEHKESDELVGSTEKLKISEEKEEAKANDSDAQSIDLLYKENEELKARLTQLTKENNRLKQENTKIRAQLQADEDDERTFRESLSPSLPSLPTIMPPKKSHRSRISSFVEVDLYGEATRISDIRKQMEQWKGWQVDMRGWRTIGIGPQFEL